MGVFCRTRSALTSGSFSSSSSAPPDETFAEGDAAFGWASVRPAAACGEDADTLAPGEGEICRFWKAAAEM